MYVYGCRLPATLIAIDDERLATVGHSPQYVDCHLSCLEVSRNALLVLSLRTLL